MSASFIGREQELGWLHERLRAPRCSVVVFGGPGMGKSRLLAQALPADAVHVAVDPTADLCERVADALAVAPGPDRAERVPLALAGRIVGVDTVSVSPADWELLGGWSRIEGLRLVVAGRGAPPVGWDELLVGPLPARDAAGLFRARSTRSSPHVEALVADLAGVPLAIELAAARARLLGVEGVRERLSVELLADRRDPSRSMWAALSWSWSALTESERQAARRLALFAGAFSVEVARTTLGPAALDLLSALQEQAWLVREDAALRVPVAVRGFVTLQDAERERPAWVRGCLAAMDGARSGAMWISAPRGACPVAEPDLLELLDHVDDDELPRAACLVLGDRFTGPEGALRGRLLDRAQAACAVDSPAWFELELVRAEFRGSGPMKMLEHAQAARPGLPSDPLSQARVDHAEAIGLLVRRRVTEATALLESAHQALDGAAWSPSTQRALGNLGSALASGDRASEALVVWEELLRRDEGRGHPLTRVRTLRNMAQALLNVRSGRGSLAYIAEAMELARRHTVPQWEAYMLLREQEAKTLLGEPVDVGRTRRALVRVLAGPEQQLHATAALLPPWIYLDAGQLDAAAAACEVALGLDTPRPGVTLGVMEARIVVSALRGDFAAAGEALRDRLEAGPVSDFDRSVLTAFVDPTAPVPEPRPGNLFDAKNIRQILQSRARQLVVRPNAFELGGRVVDLSRRGPARRILWHLASVGEADADGLIQAGWPGEQIQWEAAKNRLHVTLSLLRKLGLKDVVVCVDGRYQLDGRVELGEPS